MSTPLDRDNQPGGDGRNAADWEACPDGLLCNVAERMAAQQRFADRRRALGRGSAVAGIITVVVLLAFAADSMLRPGGINCAQCKANFAHYHASIADIELAAGQAEPDAELIESVRKHLAGCHICREAFSREYPGALAVSASLHSWHTLPIAIAMQHYSQLDNFVSLTSGPQTQLNGPGSAAVRSGSGLAPPH